MKPHTRRSPASTGDSLRPRDHSETPPPSYNASTNTKSSLDITSRIEHKLAQYNASQNVLKRWLFEILSVTISAACMGAVIAILASLNNRPLARWPLGLTVITVLSKVASAALILPISEAIGQLKWSWFHGDESKDAFDFEIFDKASRGAWGSVLLLVRTRGKSLAALGALLTVLLLAIDSFFQQVTELPERWTERGEGSIPKTIRYDPALVLAYESNAFDGAPFVQANQDLVSALSPLFYGQDGIQRLPNSGNVTQVDIPISCPTSLCKWSPYLSLGVCSACSDVSDLLSYACLPMRMDWIRNSTGPTTEHTYPNGTACGYFLNATSTAPVLMSGYRVGDRDNATYGETLLMRILPLVTNPLREPLYDGSINFKHLSNPIVDALIVSAADGTADSVYRKQIPVAQECILSWCVKTLRSSYSWGTYEEVVEDTFFNTTKTKYPWTAEAEKDGMTTTYDSNITIYPPTEAHDGQGYGVSNDTIFNTVIILDAVFPSFITVADPTAQPFMKIKTSFIDKVMYRAARSSPWVAPNNITRHMEKIATALTNVVRSDAESSQFIAGQAYAPETYVEVKWAWLTFPIAMLVLSIMFLAATMIRTSQTGDEGLGAWKTSAMPTLMYSLPLDMRHNLTTAATWRSEESGGAKRVKIRLMPDQGWRVSGYMSTSPTTRRRNSPRAPAGWI